MVILSLLVMAWLLLIGFIFYAGLKQAWNRMHWIVHVVISPVAVPFLIIFGLLDVFLRVVLGTLLYGMDWPTIATLTISKQAEYYMDNPGWKGRVGCRICKLLNSILPEHCQGKKIPSI